MPAKLQVRIQKIISSYWEILECLECMKTQVYTKKPPFHFYSVGKRIGVINSHYTSWWQRADAQSLQISLALQKMADISKQYQCPFIFCGDFNATPDRAPYYFLSKGNLDDEVPPRLIFLI